MLPPWPDAVGPTAVVRVEFQAVASVDEDDWPMGVLTTDVELISCALILPPMVMVVADDWVTVVKIVALAVTFADGTE